VAYFNAAATPVEGDPFPPFSPFSFSPPPLLLSPEKSTAKAYGVLKREHGRTDVTF